MEETTKRVTKEQKLMLIQYLEDHKEFAHDRFVNSTGVKSLSEQWDMLAEKLNALGGALKNGEHWKRAWTNMRSKAKQKFQERKNSLERSGINGAPKFKLSEMDERIIAIMRRESVVGQEEVGEPLREAELIADVSFVSENNDPGPTCSNGTGRKHFTFTQRRKRKKDLSEDLLEIEKEILKEKRKKNEIAQAQVNVLNSINKTLLQILKKV